MFRREKGQNPFFFSIMSSSNLLLPQPCVNGDVVAVKIPEAAYQAGLQRCKNHLHGRLILAKGTQPTKFVELKSKLLK
ncbi:hypothetical protein Lal_00021843 [Lupinus albus]|nr:hypothetical protein Lal_00021843 [Lupinus albus]